MEVIRKRPIKQFEVIVAHGPYSKGALIQPTGIYRDALLRRGIIREYVEQSGPPLTDRMVHEPRQDLPLAKRKGGR